MLPSYSDGFGERAFSLSIVMAYALFYLDPDEEAPN
jgi:hypothetical protein